MKNHKSLTGNQYSGGRYGGVICTSKTGAYNHPDQRYKHSAMMFHGGDYARISRQDAARILRDWHNTEIFTKHQNQ